MLLNQTLGLILITYNVYGEGINMVTNANRRGTNNIDGINFPVSRVLQISFHKLIHSSLILRLMLCNKQAVQPKYGVGDVTADFCQNYLHEYLKTVLQSID